MDTRAIDALLAKATEEVVEKIRRVADLDDMQTKFRSGFMQTLSTACSSPEEVRQHVAEQFPEFEQHVLNFIRARAKLEIEAAVQTATLVSASYVEFRKRLIAHDHKDAQIVSGATAQAERWQDVLSKTRADLVALMQQAQHLDLQHCFECHFVSEETASKLAELYTVLLV